MNKFILEIKSKVAKAKSLQYQNKSNLYKKINFDDHGIYQKWSDNEFRESEKFWQGDDDEQN